MSFIPISAQPLSPDFFLPEEELRSFPNFEEFAALYSSSTRPAESSGGSGSGDSVEGVFNKIKSVLSEEIVKRTSGVYSFQITGVLTLMSFLVILCFDFYSLVI